jgi:hypothetical protein
MSGQSCQFVIPAVYIPPLGTPLYWRDEESGVLRDAVWAYYCCGFRTGTITAPEIAVVVEYLRYVISAPCWDNNPFCSDEERVSLADLRRTIAEMTVNEGEPQLTACAVSEWIDGCLELGIDPL